MKRTAPLNRCYAKKPGNPALPSSSRPSRLSGKHIVSLRLNPRHPPVSVEELAMMLEIDLALGRRGDFIKRLQNALDAAAFSDG